MISGPSQCLLSSFFPDIAGIIRTHPSNVPCLGGSCVHQDPCGSRLMPVLIQKSWGRALISFEVVGKELTHRRLSFLASSTKSFVDPGPFPFCVQISLDYGSAPSSRPDSRLAALFFCIVQVRTASPSRVNQSCPSTATRTRPRDPIASIAYAPNRSTHVSKNPSTDASRRNPPVLDFRPESSLSAVAPLQTRRSEGPGRLRTPVTRSVR